MRVTNQVADRRIRPHRAVSLPNAPVQRRAA
jgi:hypothetical protein